MASAWIAGFLMQLILPKILNILRQTTAATTGVHPMGLWGCGRRTEEERGGEDG